MTSLFRPSRVNSSNSVLTRVETPVIETPPKPTPYRPNRTLSLKGLLGSKDKIEIIRLKTDIEALQADNASNLAKIQRQTTIIEESQLEKDGLIERNQALTLKNEKITHEYHFATTQLEDKLTTLREESSLTIQSLELKVSQLEEEKDSWRGEAFSFQLEREKLQVEVGDLSLNLQQQLGTNEQLNSTICELQGGLQQSKNENEAYLTQKDQLESTICELRNDLSNAQNRNDALTIEVEQLTRDRDRLRTDLSSLQESSTERVEALEANTTLLQNAKNNLLDGIGRLEVQLSALQQEFLDQSQKLEAEMKANSVLSAESEVLRDNLRAKDTELCYEREAASLEKENMDREREGALKQIANLEADFVILKDHSNKTKTALENDNAELSRANQSLDSELLRLKKELTDTTTMLGKQVASNSENQSRIESLQEQVEGLMQQKQDIGLELWETQTSIFALRGEIADRKKELEQLHEEVVEERKAKKELYDTISKLEENLQDTTNRFKASFTEWEKENSLISKNASAYRSVLHKIRLDVQSWQNDSMRHFPLLNTGGIYMGRIAKRISQVTGLT